jgi:hypothetical protein
VIVPSDRRERWMPAVVLGALVVGCVLAGMGLAGLLRHAGSAPASAALPVAPAAVQLPVPAVSGAAPVAPAPAARTEPREAARFARNDRAHVTAGWVAAYYPLYEAAQNAFGVNWMLIAAIHKQETAFSTSRGIYSGLNFARCCAGPMQFNVTNGPVSTWARYRDAYKAAPRPASYNHATARHPSVYDDFDAIMAAGKLLRDNGARMALDGAAWSAAYGYYGHDLTGVDYANAVLARALRWGHAGFCINCEADADILARVDGAWGSAVRASLAPPAEKPEHKPAATGPKALAARKR